MSITVQQTPNPNARKFVLPAIYFEQPLNVSDAETAGQHPLAARLFALDGVYNVFLARDFVTVNKLPDAVWDPIESQVTSILIEHFNQFQTAPNT